MAGRMPDKQRKLLAKRVVAARQTRQFSQQARNSRQALHGSSRSRSRSSSRSPKRIANRADMYSQAVRTVNCGGKVNDLPNPGDTNAFLDTGGLDTSSFMSTESGFSLSGGMFGDDASIASTSTAAKRTSKVRTLRNKQNDPWHIMSVQQSEVALKRQANKQQDLHRRQKELGVKLQQQIEEKRQANLKEAQLKSSERQKVLDKQARDRQEASRRDREVYEKKVKQRAELRQSFRVAIEHEEKQRRRLREQELALDRQVLAKEQRDLQSDKQEAKAKRDKLLAYQATILRDRRDLLERRQAQFEKEQAADVQRLQRAITAPSMPRRTYNAPSPDKLRFLKSMEVMMSREAEKEKREELARSDYNQKRNDKEFRERQAKDERHRQQMKEHLAGLYVQAREKQQQRSAQHALQNRFEAGIVQLDLKHLREQEDEREAARQKARQHRRMIEEQIEQNRIKKEKGALVPMSPVEYSLNKAVLLGEQDPPDRVF